MTPFLTEVTTRLVCVDSMEKPPWIRCGGSAARQCSRGTAEQERSGREVGKYPENAREYRAACAAAKRRRPRGVRRGGHVGQAWPRSGRLPRAAQAVRGHRLEPLDLARNEAFGAYLARGATKNPARWSCSDEAPQDTTRNRHNVCPLPPNVKGGD